VPERLSVLPRPTVRLRLTLIYGALFVVAGAFLLVLLYGLLSRALDPGPPPGGARGGGGRPPQEQTIGDQGSRTVEEQIQDARREERESALEQVRIQAGIALLVTSAGALLLGWLVAGRVLRPLRAITLHARHASEETLDERISLGGPPDELKELADTIDGMLDRLQAAFDSQRRFSAEASHELRTPLAIIRAEVDVALAGPGVTERERRLAESIRAAADRAERLIDGLLALARSDSTLRDRDRVDLAELVGDVVGEQARAADAAGVTLDLELDTAEVDGDRALLWRLIGNLVENAIRYNQEGGWVSVQAGTSHHHAFVRVANSGPVIVPEQIAELFRPFQRSEQARRVRGGVGLGLAIVRSVSTAHGGEIEATANPEGGLTITIRMPAWDAGTPGVQPSPR